jgi:4-hydroxy-tetrahydrodipicolinate reductase
MRIIVAGTGKLATELMNSDELRVANTVAPWSNVIDRTSKSVLVHAGSGRELGSIASYCDQTQSTLIELSTGSKFEFEAMSFPLVICPNTNILMLKFMNLFEVSGHQFRGYDIEVFESHQAGKTSVAGTAVSIANSLEVKEKDIRSVRDANIQRTEFQIPESDLPRHAFHRIEIKDRSCGLRFESIVLGDAPYAAGVVKIIDVLRSRTLESRRYSVMDFVKNGWL